MFHERGPAGVATPRRAWVNQKRRVTGLPVPEEAAKPEKAVAPSAALEWLSVLSEIQLPTPDEVRRLTKWAEPHDPIALRETAYSLVQKWTEVKHKYKNPFSTFQGWVRVAERGSPNSARPAQEPGESQLDRIRKFKREVEDHG